MENNKSFRDDYHEKKTHSAHSSELQLPGLGVRISPASRYFSIGDMIATVLALKIGGFLMGRPRSDWRALIFASTQEPVRGPFLFVLHIQFIGKNQKH